MTTLNSKMTFFVQSRTVLSDFEPVVGLSQNQKLIDQSDYAESKNDFGLISRKLVQNGMDGQTQKIVKQKLSRMENGV